MINPKSNHRSMGSKEIKEAKYQFILTVIFFIMIGISASAQKSVVGLVEDAYTGETVENMNVHVTPASCANSKTTDIHGMYITTLTCDTEKEIPRIVFDHGDWDFLDPIEKFIVPKGKENIAIVNVRVCRKAQCETARKRWEETKYLLSQPLQDLTLSESEALTPKVEILVVLNGKLRGTGNKKDKKMWREEIEMVSKEVLDIREQYTTRRVGLYRCGSRLVTLIEKMQPFPSNLHSAMAFLEKGQVTESCIAIEQVVNGKDFDTWPIDEKKQLLTLLCELYTLEDVPLRRGIYRKMLEGIGEIDSHVFDSSTDSTTSVSENTSENDAIEFKGKEAVLLLTHKLDNKALYFKQGKRITYWIMGGPIPEKGRIKGVTENSIVINGEEYALSEIAKVEARGDWTNPSRIFGGFFIGGGIALWGYGIVIAGNSIFAPLVIAFFGALGTAAVALGAIPLLIKKQAFDMSTSWDLHVVDQIPSKNRGRKTSWGIGD